eukprot:scaffold1282_cov251-Pinguiococcus_pyrenoidosus.AAC.82
MRKRYTSVEVVGSILKPQGRDATVPSVARGSSAHDEGAALRIQLRNGGHHVLMVVSVIPGTWSERSARRFRGSRGKDPEPHFGSTIRLAVSAPTKNTDPGKSSAFWLKSGTEVTATAARTFSGPTRMDSAASLSSSAATAAENCSTRLWTVSSGMAPLSALKAVISYKIGSTCFFSAIQRETAASAMRTCPPFSVCTRSAA